MSGTFIVSLDFELLWGLAGWNVPQINAYKSHVEGSRLALESMLEIFDQYNVKSTIAFVGGMNFSSKQDFELIAPQLRPHYSESIFSSYNSLIPYIGSSFEEELFFCQEIIDKLSLNPNVELASHTFSHYYCLEKGQHEDEFEADIQTVRQEANKMEYPMRTIIFPRNQVSSDYLALCKLYGFTHYRGNLETFLYRSEQTPSKFSLRRILRLVDAYINLSGYNVYSSPIVDKSGLLNVPGSRFLRPYSPALSILEPFKVRRIKKSIEYAAKHFQMYHLWWHPHNFGLHTKENIKQLKRICCCFQDMHESYGMQSRFISEIKIDR